VGDVLRSGEKIIAVAKTRGPKGLRLKRGFVETGRGILTVPLGSSGAGQGEKVRKAR